MLITKCKHARHCGQNKYLCFEKLHGCPYASCETPRDPVAEPEEEKQDVFEMCINDPEVITFTKLDRRTIKKRKDIVIKYFKLGLTCFELASAFELQEATLRKWLREAGFDKVKKVV